MIRPWTRFELTAKGRDVVAAQRATEAAAQREYEQLQRSMYGFSVSDLFRDVDVCLEHGTFDPSLKQCPKCAQLAGTRR